MRTNENGLGNTKGRWKWNFPYQLMETGKKPSQVAHNGGGEKFEKRMWSHVCFGGSCFFNHRPSRNVVEVPSPGSERKGREQNPNRPAGLNARGESAPAFPSVEAGLFLSETKKGQEKKSGLSPLYNKTKGWVAEDVGGQILRESGGGLQKRNKRKMELMRLQIGMGPGGRKK